MRGWRWRIAQRSRSLSFAILVQAVATGICAALHEETGEMAIKRSETDQAAIIVGAMAVGAIVAACIGALIGWASTRRSAPLGGDPVLAIFREAPIDDEPLTEDQAARLDAAQAAVARGEVVPLSSIAHAPRRATA